MGYAEDTKVPVGRSQDEIRKTLTKHGAVAFLFGESREMGEVTFRMSNRMIRIKVPFPVNPSSKATPLTQAVMKKHEQIIRSRWRVLLLTIKAKLECVEASVSTLEEEFMAFVVLPNGKTVGKEIANQLENAYATGNMPPLIGYNG